MKKIFILMVAGIVLLISAEALAIAMPNLKAIFSHDDSAKVEDDTEENDLECGWCGNSCINWEGKNKRDVLCATVMPPTGAVCKEMNGACISTTTDASATTTTTVPCIAENQSVPVYPGYSEKSCCKKLELCKNKDPQVLGSMGICKKECEDDDEDHKDATTTTRVCIGEGNVLTNKEDHCCKGLKMQVTSSCQTTTVSTLPTSSSSTSSSTVTTATTGPCTVIKTCVAKPACVEYGGKISLTTASTVKCCSGLKAVAAYPGFSCTDKNNCPIPNITEYVCLKKANTECRYCSSSDSCISKESTCASLSTNEDDDNEDNGKRHWGAQCYKDAATGNCYLGSYSSISTPKLYSRFSADFNLFAAKLWEWLKR